MIVGIPKEIKNSENRVGLTESSVFSLTKQNHKVIIEKAAGKASQISDDNFIKAGAEIRNHARDIYEEADIIIKVKEPQPEEFDLLKENSILFTFLHLAAEPELTEVLCSKKIKSLAYETIEDKDGKLPLLSPMSAIAGRVALLNGVYYLQKHVGGKGVLAGGTLSYKNKVKVTVVGGGIAGTNAADMALGIGADVSVFDVNQESLKKIDQTFKGRLKTVISNKENLTKSLSDADLVIGAVLIAGAKSPKVITADMLKQMPEKSVAADISIDQGGCLETARPTSHSEPVFEKHNVIHYCVPNIPSVVCRTSTYALNEVSLPFIEEVVNKGLEKAIKDNAFLKKGLNTYAGHLTSRPVSKALNKDYVEYDSL